MTQVMIQMEDELSKELHQVCEDIGLPVSAAFLIFAKRVARDRKIPFELSAAPDPFDAPRNMEHLRRSIAQLNAGQGTEHELIEDTADA
ncbi:MAG: type II toxin-antitoxin system RelB/DinJ family antitoxin [Selenomonas sp.]|jgi:DNA damage-inducible protein|uniref:type II toxin-antitoxin system RelB/DinJ family antitoxin n=1 Tax=Selenomonas sp. TaxID=2053611 RepID=UPI001CB53FFA|nr:type II toxin-antitoxin system RelB/DinJ family antitoxin [Selenomonas sp.]MBF1685046.1 type II toxin-antitoxin system RelB/DinJ family antitoxin [Selenomonas sp.]MBF1694714.1 type II toxin-antitoxin system RelB/DinJ family antitoxin [Selenomonas sp.]